MKLRLAGKPKAFILHPSAFILETLERETRFELATSTLARSHSTTELLPLSAKRFYRSKHSCQAEVRGRSRSVLEQHAVQNRER